MKICGLLFISGKPSKLYARTNLDWVSTLNLDYTTSEPNVATYERHLKLDSQTFYKVRKPKLISQHPLEETSHEVSSDSNEIRIHNPLVRMRTLNWLV